MASKYSVFAEGSRRLLAALQGEPGPVPVYAQMHEYAAVYAGIPPRDFYTRPEIMLPALLAALVKGKSWTG